MGITLIMGQGYVGLPLAQALTLTKTQTEVLGFDVREGVVINLSSGSSHVDDISDFEVREMLSKGYRATSNPEDISKADTIVICVPTPLKNSGEPDISYIDSAANLITNHMKPGALVILESTTYPGTTENILRPILEDNRRVLDKDFHLAFSPERIDPGNATFKISNTPKIVGGSSPESTKRAADFYKLFVNEVIETTGTQEAETAKLLENTYRHVNIALINEMAILCHEMNIDIWEVVRLASSKPYGFQPFYPGPGVGGHCIPIDPNYLSYETKRRLGKPFRFIEMATEVNSSMPHYILTRIQDILNQQKVSIKGSKILILGITYKPDIADARESTSFEIAELLTSKGAQVSFNDPFQKSFVVAGAEVPHHEKLDESISVFDLVLLLQAHSPYDIDSITLNAKYLFDTRGKAKGPNVEKL
jgi:UDP-N-acetyl-D-glucosamine dehydrogenase